jgi:hypothetical protein
MWEMRHLKLVWSLKRLEVLFLLGVILKTVIPASSISTFSVSAQKLVIKRSIICEYTPNGAANILKLIIK